MEHVMEIGMESKQIQRYLLNLHSGKQREMSAKNADDLCTWVYRWGWTTAQIINRFLDLKRPSLADEFVKKGLLEKMNSKEGYREKFVYILSEEGKIRAQELLDLDYGHVETLPYKLNESRKIPWSLHSHNMVCQHVMIDMLGPRIQPISYITELEYRKDNALGEAVPDMGFHFGDEFVYCEIEIHQKELMRMKRWVWLRILDLRKNSGTRVMFFTNLNSVKDAIEKIISATHIYEVEKNEKGFLVESNTRHIVMDKYRHRIEIKMLQKETSRKSGGLYYPTKYNTEYEEEPHSFNGLSLEMSMEDD